MIDIDITMPIQIINILILIVFMNAVLYRPVRSILEERRKRMDELDKEAETFNKNAKLRLEEFDRKLHEARQQAKEKFEQVRGEALTTSSEQLAQVRQEADGTKQEQLGQIAKQFAAAQQELKGQVEGFAQEMASKVLGRAL